MPNPPRPQRQSLQPQSHRPNIHHKSKHPNKYTHNIHNIVSITFNVACPRARFTALFRDFVDTGKGSGDEFGAVVVLELEIGGHGCRGDAGCAGECVDESEDWVAGECAAEV